MCVWSLSFLCGSHLQSQVTLKMTSKQLVETSVTTNKRPPQDWKTTFNQGMSTVVAPPNQLVWVLVISTILTKHNGTICYFNLKLFLCPPPLPLALAMLLRCCVYVQSEGFQLLSTLRGGGVGFATGNESLNKVRATAHRCLTIKMYTV